MFDTANTCAILVCAFRVQEHGKNHSKSWAQPRWPHRKGYGPAWRPLARNMAGRAGAGPHLAEAFFSTKMPSHLFLCHQLLGHSKWQQSEYTLQKSSHCCPSGHLLLTTHMQAHCASSQEITQTPAMIAAWHHWFMGTMKVPKYVPKHTWQSAISLFGVRGKGVQPDSDWKRLAAVQHYYPNFPKNNKKKHIYCLYSRNLTE